MSDEDRTKKLPDEPEPEDLATPNIGPDTVDAEGFNEFVWSLNEWLKRLNAGLKGLDTKVDQRLASIEETIDKRLKDTRPLWESVQSQLDDLREGQAALGSQLQRLDDKIDVLNKHFLDLYADERETRRRVDDIEKRAS